VVSRRRLGRLAVIGVLVNQDRQLLLPGDRR
jgi:hypothetical protein